MDDLHIAALEYGIILKDLGVIDRQFKTSSPSVLCKPKSNANVDRENSNKVKQEEGVVRIKAQARNTESDAEAYSVIAAVKAAPRAHATRLVAEAEAIRIKANVDRDVRHPFAHEMAGRRLEVMRVSAFGNKAVFVPTDPMAVAAPTLTGMAAGIGVDLRK